MSRFGRPGFLVGMALTLSLAGPVDGDRSRSAERSVGSGEDAGAEALLAARTLEFRNGKWFTGKSFVARTVYAKDGFFTFSRPGRVDSTLDLAGAFVVPPFGEAHNHNLESSRSDRTIADSACVDWRGLDPALLPEIARRAHAAGLRVSTHVETAADFRAAVAAGADEINHLPGFRPDEKRPLTDYAIHETDAKLAARRGVTVVTTVSPLIEALERRDPESEEGRRDLVIREMLSGNLRLLHRSGVRIAIGSDRYEETARAEVLALARLGVFDATTLLRLWCENTAATIFPERKIGRLAEGYEASFLALDGNPLEDFTRVGSIRLRVKQGVVLETGGAAE